MEQGKKEENTASVNRGMTELQRHDPFDLPREEQATEPGFGRGVEKGASFAGRDANAPFSIDARNPK